MPVSRRRRGVERRRRARLLWGDAGVLLVIIALETMQYFMCTYSPSEFFDFGFFIV
jgi:hypothetical protein